MKNLIILTVCLAILSCGPTDKSQNGSNLEKTVNPDSLTAVFAASWNTKDTLAAVNILAENVVVMNDTLIYTGIGEVTENWVRGGIKVVSNIKTVSSIQGASERMAYDAGTYSLAITIPGGPVLKEKGNYSFIWTKSDTSDWKLTLIHLEDISRMPE